jgi:hypothetical protein
LITTPFIPVQKVFSSKENERFPTNDDLKSGLLITNYPIYVDLQV